MLILITDNIIINVMVLQSKLLKWKYCLSRVEIIKVINDQKGKWINSIYYDSFHTDILIYTFYCKTK